MKKNKPSLTAELTTFARAAESAKPATRRLCYDPLARDFLNAPLRLLAKSRVLAGLVVWCAERLAPGVPGEVLGRTKYIDDCLKTSIEDGIEQLVILGAGYDSRPYRFDGLAGAVTVFEVDHPATQRVKMRRVERLLGRLPNHVVFVPVDFEEEKLHRLFEKGYDRNKKTFFIWEGVTYYLSAKAVDETLAFVVENSGTGSSIIFDYAFQKVLQGAADAGQVNRALKAWERIGAPLTTDEHFIFGVKEGTIQEFLAARGFCQIENVNGDSFKSSYFKDLKQSADVSHICGFVRATVRSGNRAPQGS
ncbi:MAG: SAM-dependent methyltransferase [Dehalococcoidia bacterium]|nr:SAM-dependent methyltransferase [Dehalococcoidia bacterium]